jgi:hypothetical protein
MIRFTLTAHDDETGETVTLHNEVLPFRPAPRASHKRLRTLASAVEVWVHSREFEYPINDGDRALWNAWNAYRAPKPEREP